MSIANNKNNILLQLTQSAQLAIWSLQEANKKNSIGGIKNCLNNARNCGEAMCKYLVLDKMSNGLNILNGVDNGFTNHSDSRTRKGIGKEIELYTIIEVLYQNRKLGNNEEIRANLHRIRFKGNKGSHTTLNEEQNPTLRDCEKLIKYVLDEQIEWFFSTINLAIPREIHDAFKIGVKEVDLPVFSEWYLFKNQQRDFEDISAQYILIVDSNFKKDLSANEISTFAKSSVNWNLIIDFDNESQQNGFEKAFKKVLGKEEMRTITKGDSIPDANCLFYFLAQGKAVNEIEKNPTKWEKDKNGYGKTLERLLSKIKPRKKVFITIIVNDIAFSNKVLSVIYDCYSSIANDIIVTIITNNPNSKTKYIEVIDNDFSDMFGEIHYHLFDFNKLVSEGFSLKERITEVSENEYIIPSFTNDRKHSSISLGRDTYEDLKVRQIELVHKNIGKEELTQDTNFYLGDEINWHDLEYLGKGKDIERNKITKTVLPELLELLQNKPKGVWIYKLNHEASAGGTTAAKRIAYEIGVKLPNAYPTVLIHKYIPSETAKCIADLYEKTLDKPILAIIEEYEIGEKLLNKLETEIRDLQKTLVVLYVCRINQTVEEKDKDRRLPAQLETVELEYFEKLFSNLKPERKNDILLIKKGESRLQMPFIYGLTTFGKEFKKVDSYIDSVLDNIKNLKLLRFLGYIALIGRYSQNAIPESLFHSYLDIPDGMELRDIINDEELDSIDRVCSFNYEQEGNADVRCIRIRNSLFAEEISEKLLTSRNKEHRHLWKANIKNWFLEIISIIKNAYGDGGLYPLDKKIIDALFIDKENYVDEQEKATFSRLITAINKEVGFRESRDILKSLVEAFQEYSDEAFYSQHLARLFYSSAKNEQGITFEEKNLFFDNAIKYADKAIQLYLLDPESDKSTSGLYHTKGHAALLKVEFINSNFNSYSKKQALDIIEQEVKELFDVSSQAFDECLHLDENSTYGYLSYSYLIVQILNFGRRKSNYSNFIEFFEDSEYEWYLDKRDLGIDIITKALDFWSKFNVNRRDDIQDIESGSRISKKLKFEEKIEQNLASLLFFKKAGKYAMSKRDYEIKIRNAKSQAQRVLWQNAYIEYTLGEKDFSNYYNGITRLNSDELNDMVQLLRTNLEYKPTLRDLKRWLRAVRSNSYSIDIQTAINFLEYINNISPENSLLFKLEVAYYLYCLLSIQTIDEGKAIDTNKINKINQFQKFCKDVARKLSLRRTASFEWLGKNKEDGLEQLVSRDKLGDITARREFFKDISGLREVSGVIKSVGSGTDGSERKIGEIELENNPSLKAFFIPIHGGYIMMDGIEKKCSFDNTNNINTRVKFFLGFSYDGLRAYQPIPEDALRVDNSIEEVTSKSKIINELNDNLLKFRVTDVRPRELMGNIEGLSEFIFVPFPKDKSYQDYRYFRGQTIGIVKGEDNTYKIE